MVITGGPGPGGSKGGVGGSETEGDMVEEFTGR